MIMFNPKGPSTKSTVMGNRTRLSIYSISVKAESKQSKSIKVNKDNKTIQESMNTKISKNNKQKQSLNSSRKILTILCSRASDL